MAPDGQNADNYNDKYHALELAVLGCNRRVGALLADACDGVGFRSHMFYEYFLPNPVCISAEHISGVLLAPFVKKYLRGRPLVPDPDRLLEGHEIPRTRKVLARLQQSTFGLPTLTRKVLTQLKTMPNTAAEAPLHVSIVDKTEFDTYRSQIDNVEDGNLRDGCCREWAVLNRVWQPYFQQSGNKRQLVFACQPICSKDVLYGVLLLVAPPATEQNDFPPPQRNHDKYSDAVCKWFERKRLTYVLRHVANTEYLPLVILVHNWLDEKALRDTMSQTPPGDPNALREPVFLQLGRELDRRQKQFKHPLERKLRALWQSRKAALEKDNTFAVKESLLFPKYAIASPGMIEKVSKALALQIEPCKEDPIPTVLISGGAGTGKDTMAKLVAAGANTFRFAPTLTINMSTLRPNGLSGQLLMGSALGDSLLHFDGMLKRAVDQARNGPEKESGDRPALVVILDELNSLDIDMQGILLRFIENRELVRIGECHSAADDSRLSDVDLLIIGLVNENPEMLAKLSTIEEITRQKNLFSGLLGEIMYEYFRRLRRLREDLYYRMRRGGMIEIPGLNDRREDIPILFEKFLEHEIGLCVPEMPETHRTIIDFDAYGVLMTEGIDWPGNIRQLQAVAKYVALRIAEREADYRVKLDACAKEDPVWVSASVVRQVLREQGLLPDQRLREELVREFMPAGA